MNIGPRMFSSKKVIFITIPVLPFIVNGWKRERARAKATNSTGNNNVSLLNGSLNMRSKI